MSKTTKKGKPMPLFDSDKAAEDFVAAADLREVKLRILITAMSAVLLVGCSESAPSKNAGAGIANPASEHCVKMGGKIEIRKEAKGEVGYCHLPDGRTIEEWQFFRSWTPATTAISAAR